MTTVRAASHEWPTTREHGPLGDGRYALRRERPGSIEALQEVVDQAASEGLAIYPQGGRSALDYGGTPARPGIAVDLTGLDRIVDYPVDDLTITVEAGVRLKTIRELLAPHRQQLAIDAPLPDQATIGGVYATQFAGSRRFGWGRPRDQIIGVQFVLADGRLIKGGGQVVKNAAGYDFPRWLTGSMGTLGIIATLGLKVRPMTEATAMAWVEVATIDKVSHRLDELAVAPVRPSAIELLSGSAARAIADAAKLDLPVSADWVIAVGFDDNSASVAWQVDQVRNVLGRGSTIVDAAAAEALWSALRDYPDRAEGAVGIVANVRPSAVGAMVSRLDPTVWQVQAHAGNGIVRAWGASADGIPGLRAEAVAAGGNLMLSRATLGQKARVGVWGAPRADWPLMEQLRQALDPESLLNPGRFLTATQ